MRVAVLVSLARQVEGEYVFMNVIKAHIDPEVLKQFLNQTDLPKTGSRNISPERILTSSYNWHTDRSGVQPERIKLLDQHGANLVTRPARFPRNHFIHNEIIA